jgi:hypothetical protein
VRLPIYDSSIGIWRRYARELAPLAEILRPVLPAFVPNGEISLSSGD